MMKKNVIQKKIIQNIKYAKRCSLFFLSMKGFQKNVYNFKK